MAIKQYFTTNEMILLSGLKLPRICELSTKYNVLNKVSRGCYDWQSLLLARSIKHIKDKLGKKFYPKKAFKAFLNFNVLNNTSVIIVYKNIIQQGDVYDLMNITKNKEITLKDFLLMHNTCEYVLVDEYKDKCKITSKKIGQSEESFLLENHNKLNLGVCIIMTKVVSELWELGYEYKIPHFANKADFAPISLSKDIILNDDLILIH
ncbi:hypothetical protein [Gloeothece verrucosa]|uniref:Uncharacterized protein n=1 Tax=Gloeothece verrucosa (strain PCC 7822) TaxID=497965 RepID=E0UP07_GLOV7|nr:hypothetical protein [Gloeothece verrucosa]ADN18687.1 hypothetical protein Cyan7822_6205 [Gloeothece verrucosa PCC 7822]